MPLVTQQENDIAIIGLSGRFPGAANVDAFWQNLCDGVESIVPLGEKELSRIDRLLRENTDYVAVHAPLEGVALFDAAFFDMTPREAAMVDPQQRLFLECAWETLEVAGYDPERFAGRIGVFAGSGMNTYLLHNVLTSAEMVEPESHFSVAIANDKDYLTTRVAYKLNLKGPAITVQTACSTSLVSVHMACQSVLSGECEMALAGGVAVRVPQDEGYVFYEGGIVSPDGHCRTFDADAKGTVFGSGVGSVLLKRLSAAQQDGDTIYAVIKGSAVNNDGALKVGFTAPNVDCQAEVIAEAQAIGGVRADSIGYVEAHGTGTPMGDPIEITALTRAFRLATQERGFCAIGSAKTNVGHLDTAAGITGLIKTIQALRHHQIPPTLNFHSPNPHIDWHSSPFFVCDRLTDWPLREGTRRAGVSSFGIGGTNAHVVLEQAPIVQPAPSQPWQLLLLSARTPAALESATLQLGEHLQRHPELEMADVAYTTHVGRKAFDHRRFVVCENMADAGAILGGADRERLNSDARTSTPRNIIFMFPGQGSQYVNMGRELYQTEPAFRDEVDRCAKLLLPDLGLDIRDVIYPADARADEMTGKLEETSMAQPAIFVVSYALARLWMKWGVHPRAMIGHSIGEYVAACLAGVFSLQDALALVAARGRMMRDLPRGAMMAVSLPEDDVRGMLNGALCLAAVNATSRCVVSGPTPEVEAFEQRLAADGVACRRLHTSHAFHSSMMDPVLAPFAARVAQVLMRSPQIPYLSNVTGDWIRSEQLNDPTYWASHLRDTVKFSDGIGRLLEDNDARLLEVGPSRTLGSAVLQHSGRAPQHLVLSTLRHSHDVRPDRAFLLNTVGRLWTTGVEIDWPTSWEGERRTRVALPTYPFGRHRHWIEAGVPRAKPAEAKSLDDSFYVPSWKRTLVPVVEPKPDAPRRWLLFMDDAGLGAALHARLVAAGEHVTRVAIGKSFSSIGENSYALDPARSEDYAQLLTELANDRTSSTHIVHLWSVTTPHVELENAPSAMASGFYSLMALAQAIGQSSPEPRRLYVISNGVCAVTGTETLEPLKATLLGPCKVMPREYPQLRCSHIDIEWHSTSNDIERLKEQLLAELFGNSEEASIAYRGPHRWSQTFDNVRIGADAGLARFEVGATYLITGGLGALGLHFADVLGRMAHTRLILLGQSDFPTRDQWQPWLRAHADSDATSETIQRLQQIEEAGGEVLIVKGDVTSRDSLAAAIEQGRKQFGKIHGVIHAAGIAGGGMMQTRTAEECAAVLAPKLDGARNLRDLFQHDPPATFILCSSIEAVLGSFGQADYCAANCFLDAFAYASTYRDEVPMVSINWDMWRDTGMAASMPNRKSKDTADNVHPLLGKRLPSSPGEHLFEAVFRPEEQWVLNEHRIFNGEGVVPGTAYLEMARAAFADIRGKQPVEFSSVMFIHPLRIPDGQSRDVRTMLIEESAGMSFAIHTRDAAREEAWQDHAVGRIAASAPSVSGTMHNVSDIIADLQLSEVPITSAQKEAFAHLGFGPRWNTVEQVFVGATDALARLALPDEYVGDFASLMLHPALLDTAVGYANLHVGGGSMFLPLSYDRIRISQALPMQLYSQVHFASGSAASSDTIRYDVLLMDLDGRELARIDGLVFRRIETSSSASRKVVEQRARTSATTKKTKSGGLRPADGREALRRIITRPVGSQVIVSTRHPDKVIEDALRDQEAEIVEHLARPSSSVTQSRPNLSSAYEDPREGVETQLAKIWSEVLGVQPVGRNDNFFELGGESVVAIQMVAKARHVGLDLTPQHVFRNQSIAELASQIGNHAAPSSREEAVAVQATQAFELLNLDEDAMRALGRQVDAIDAGQRRGS